MNRANLSDADLHYRHNPFLVARGLEYAEAERQEVQRALDGHKSKFRDQPREQLATRAAQLDADNRYWRLVLDQAQAAGRWVDESADETSTSQEG